MSKQMNFNNSLNNSMGKHSKTLEKEYSEQNSSNEIKPEVNVPTTQSGSVDGKAKNKKAAPSVEPRTFEEIKNDLEALSKSEGKRALSAAQYFIECARGSYLRDEKVFNEFLNQSIVVVEDEKPQYLLLLYQKVWKEKMRKESEQLCSKVRHFIVKESTNTLMEYGISDLADQRTKCFNSSNENKEQDFRDLLLTLMANIEHTKKDPYQAIVAVYLWAMICCLARRKDNFLEMAQMIQQTILDTCIKPSEETKEAYLTKYFTDALRDTSLKEIGKCGYLYAGQTQKIESCRLTIEQYKKASSEYEEQLNDYVQQISRLKAQISVNQDKIDALQKSVADVESDKIAAEERLDFERNQNKKAIKNLVESLKESLLKKIGLEMEGIEVLSEDAPKENRELVQKRLNRINRIINSIGD